MIPGEHGSPADGEAGRGAAAPIVGGTSWDDEAAEWDRMVVHRPSATSRLTMRLQVDAPRVIANWTLRVANLPAFRATPDLGLEQLRDTVPEYLTAALSGIAGGDLHEERLARANEAAHQHGVRRARAGFGIGATLAEFQELRAEIWAAICRAVDADPTLEPALREMHDRVAGAFDAAMIAAAEGWVTTRLGSD